MKNNRLQFLLQLLVNNSINAQELSELADLLSQPGNEHLIDDQLKHTWENTSNEFLMDDKVYQQIVDHPRFTLASQAAEQKNIRTKSWPKAWYYAAAAMFLCCSVGLGIYFYSKENVVGQRTAIAKPASRQQDHSSQATLTLSSGKQIVLDELAAGTISSEGEVSITKNENGELVYDWSKMADDGALRYNTMTTPVGGNYQLVLADGTKVWLNAKSSLRFPIAFKGDSRKVELTGEAYFEVAHQQHQPFLVTAKNMTIQVLGTHFNVSAYDDDKLVKASLLEGSIKAISNQATLLIKPGQQALLRANGELSTASFNEDEVMDWKNGYFVFRNEPIAEIMKKISRWYHIDVNYKDNLNGQFFGGKYLKSNSLEELLSSLELTGTVKFKIDGRRVTVMQ